MPRRLLAGAEFGKVVCCFQSAQEFNSRYATFSFNDTANLDDGTVWPTYCAQTKMTAVEEARICVFVKTAVTGRPTSAIRRGGRYSGF